MKTKFVEVKSTLDGLTAVANQYSGCSYVECQLTTEISFNANSFKLMHEVEIPETLKEFRAVNNVSKKDLLKWLIKNYK